MPSVGEMIVSLQVDLGKTQQRLQTFERKSKKALKSTETAAKGTSKAFVGLEKHAKKLLVSIGGVFALRSIGRFVNGVTIAQNQVSLLSSKLGLSTEFLTEMKFAAKLAGVEFNSMSTGFQRAIRRFEEFRATGKGVAAPAAEALGIAADVKAGKTFEELLPKIADGFRNLRSEAERVRVAFALFDTEGVNLANLFRIGADGVEKFRKRARELGASLSGEQAAAADRYRAKIDELATAMEGLGNRLPIAEFSRFVELLSSFTAFAGGGKATLGGVTVEGGGSLSAGGQQTSGRSPAATTAAGRAPADGGSATSMAVSRFLFGPVVNRMLEVVARRALDRARVGSQSSGPPISRTMRDRAASIVPPAAGPPTALQADPSLANFGQTIASGVKLGAEAIRTSLTPALEGVSAGVGDVSGKFAELAQVAPGSVVTIGDTWRGFIEEFTPTAEDVVLTFGSIVSTVSAGIGSLAAQALFEAGSTSEALKQTLKEIGKQVVATLVKMAAEFLIFTAIAKLLNIGLAKQEVSTQTGIAGAAAAAASVKTFGLLGILLAPGFAAAAIAVTTAAAQSGFAAGGASQPPAFAKGGIFDGPRSGGLALLHGREAVIPLDGPYAGGGQGVAIVQIDGREIGRAVFENIPRSVRSGGLR
jgi:hypothetical protein